MTLNKLLDIRKSGSRPGEMIIISLIGDIDYSNPVISVTGQSNNYDFRPLLDLSVEIIHLGAVKTRIISLVNELLAAGVKNLMIFNPKSKQRISVRWNHNTKICNATHWI